MSLAHFATVDALCRVTKVDDELGIVKGYGVVTTVRQDDGSFAPYYDLQGDHISDDELQKAVIAYAESGAVGDEMHDDRNHGHLPELFAMTKEFADANGIVVKQHGLLITYKPSDPAVMAKFKSGEYTGFSIGGMAKRDPVTKRGGNAIDGMVEIGKRFRASLGKAQPTAEQTHALATLDGGSKRKRNNLRNLSIEKISAVDLPAQEGALVSLIKSAGGDASKAIKALPGLVLFSKSASLTTTEDGHQHLLDDRGWDGEVCDAGYTGLGQAEGDEDPHAHPWSRSADGDIVIGETLGHTHEVMSRAELEDEEGADEDDDAGGMGTKIASASAMKTCPNCDGSGMKSGKPCPMCDGTGEVAKALVPYWKRDYSADERKRMAGKEALENGSFPIKTVKDLENAIHAWGRAKGNRAAVAAHIKSRAKALGATDKLPTEGPLAEALGNTKTKTEKNMPTTEELQKRIAELEAAEKLLKAYAAMSDDEKDHHDSLKSDDAKDKFKAMSKEDRAAAMKKRIDADPVEYTCKTTGAEIRKSAGAHAIALAKRLDEQEVELAKMRVSGEVARIEKRLSTEFPFMPGARDGQVALVRAVESISDEPMRKAATEILTAMNGATGMAAAFERRGTAGGELRLLKGGDDSPQAKLETLAKKYQTDSKDASMTFEKAYEHVAFETADGRELMAKMREAARAG